jgi:hypothetical protein
VKLSIIKGDYSRISGLPQGCRAAYILATVKIRTRSPLHLLAVSAKCVLANHEGSGRLRWAACTERVWAEPSLGLTAVNIASEGFEREKAAQ